MIRTTVGYSGGNVPSPTYRRIGDHSETIRIEYDPRQVGYEKLLKVFWDSHDPQYDPYLRQYRNAIFYRNDTQKQAAEASREKIAERTGRPVMTAIEPAGPFYPAEEYHQKYLLRKADGLFAELQAIYPESADLTASTAAARINGYLGCNGEPEVLDRELPRLGLSASMQRLLWEHVTTSCDRFVGVTCPAPGQDR